MRWTKSVIGNNPIYRTHSTLKDVRVGIFQMMAFDRLGFLIIKK